MNRKTFIKNGLAGIGAFSLTGQALGRSFIEDPLPIKQELVKEFVTVGHGKIERVKEMVEEFPNIIYCSWDWGNGDFETAMEGAGHVGNKEIVHYLIEKGARISLPILTMLGKKDLVVPVLEAYPQMIYSLGAHGFTLLHHAKVGGEDAAALKEYLMEKGLKDFHVKIK